MIMKILDPKIGFFIICQAYLPPKNDNKGRRSILQTYAALMSDVCWGGIAKYCRVESAPNSVDPARLPTGFLLFQSAINL